MSGGQPDLFGEPLTPDPSIALQPLRIAAPPKPGPLHKVQFVIEFVGPRSMPAQSVALLLAPDWYQALGAPQAFVMRPSDLHWQALTDSKDGSYDSLALAWDLITPSGSITSASALQLFQFAERFGPNVNRRAMPLPHPAEVNGVVQRLQQAQEQLDIGVTLVVLPQAGAFLERDVWVACARLGLEFSPSGTFDWKADQPAFPLLSVSPIADGDSFSLRSVQQGVRHSGLAIGFNLPLSAAPVQGLDGCLFAAKQLASALHGYAVDEFGRRLSPSVEEDLKGNLREALKMFSQLGITTGSPEAQRLFA